MRVRTLSGDRPVLNELGTIACRPRPQFIGRPRPSRSVASPAGFGGGKTTPEASRHAPEPILDQRQRPDPRGHRVRTQATRFPVRPLWPPWRSTARLALRRSAVTDLAAPWRNPRSKSFTHSNYLK
jgi:hypothetical protein